MALSMRSSKAASSSASSTAHYSASRLLALNAAVLE
jgi:hypothetical protein